MTYSYEWEPRYEYAVVAAMVLEPHEWAQPVRERLTPSDFAYLPARNLFRALSEMHETGEPINTLLLFRWLTVRNRRDECGGVLALTGLADYLATTTETLVYVDIVKEDARRRKTSSALGDLRLRADDPQEPLDLVLDAAELVSTTLRRPQTTTAPPLSALFEDRVSTLHEPSPPALGRGLPWSRLMGKLSGFYPGEVTLLAARPGIGKTAFALDLARRLTPTHSVGMISLEMSVDALRDRVLSAAADVPFARIREGGLHPFEMEKVREALAEPWSSNLYLDDPITASLSAVCTSARQLVTERHIALLIIDYLQLIEPDTRTTTRQEAVATISRTVKRLSLELQIPIVALSQLNRALEGRSESRPGLSDLRESGALEQDADNVLMLYRPEAMKQAHGWLTRLIIAKQRNGDVGDVDMLFDGRTQTFEEVNQ